MTVTTTREGSVTPRQGRLWALTVVDAGLLVASGAIHLHLWDIAYRHVATLGRCSWSR